MTHSLADLLEQSVELTEQAGSLTLDYFGRSDLLVEGKPDGTEVTAADRSAEQLIREQLLARYPDDSVMGEEFGLTEGSSSRRWIIDPIDGTFGFVRGVPLYATLLALVDDDGPLLGVIHLPALRQTVSAARGEGCWSNGSRCQVAGHTEVRGSLLCTSDWNACDESQLLAISRAGAHMRTWGDAYGYAMVAAGQAEAMIDPICNIWDLAPIPVIIEEAGGRFTDLAGSRRFDSGNGIATNGAIHDELLNLMGAGND